MKGPVDALDTASVCVSLMHTLRLMVMMEGVAAMEMPAEMEISNGLPVHTAFHFPATCS